MVFEKRVTIVKITKPSNNHINNSLQWFGNSLGLFSIRDKDKSCFRVFIELLKAAKIDKPMTSDEIAYKLGLSRGTVVHHINKLIESGIVMPHARGYMLRVNNLEVLIDELKRDAERHFDDLKRVAKDIDRLLGL